LDELFADEPFLSATMKARRLHEKMQELEEQEEGAAQGMPFQAFVREVSPAPALSSNGFSHAAAAAPPREEEMIRLHEAADYLRAGSERSRVSPACAERLLHFRDETLVKWLESVPERETC